MEKVKITQEQAKSIEFLKENYHNRNIVIDHAKADNTWKWEASAINGLDIEILIAALYIGYEVEETPEDKVKNRINHWKEMQTVGGEGKAFEWLIEGAVTVLNDLNIKIEGIN